MSKKFLAVLIALSMTGFYACDDDNNDGGSSCTANTCNGSKLQICGGGKVVLEKDCGALGCNAMLGQCNSSSQPTCDTATVSAQCTSLGQVFDAASCSCKPNGTVDPNPNPGTGVVGSACDRNTYKQTCINNGANALVCWDDVVTKWDCSGGCLDAGYDPAKPLQVNCWRSSPCGCDPSNTLSNPKGDLTVSGASCDPGTYYGACSDDFTKRYYCGKDNTVVENSCNNGCDPASLGNNSSKCKSGGGSTCTGEKVTTGGTAGESCCDTATYQVSCINSNANALICSGGTVKQWDCKDSQCSVADNRVTCPNPNGSGSSAECTGETVSTGGVVGQCCDAENYNPAGCNPSSNSGLRCSNGIIKEWTCKENQTCSYDSAKKWYSCN